MEILSASLVAQQKDPGEILSKVEDILIPVQVVAPEVSLREVGEKFELLNESIMAVVDGHNRAQGVIYRSRVNELFGMRLGRELFERRPVSQFMDSDFYQFGDNTPLSEVAAAMTMDSDDEYLKQHFLIENNGSLMGMGTARKLLQVINAERIRQAIHSNPLTEMAGQVPLSELQDKLRLAEIAHGVIYFDLDHFKVFNDQYGHRRGDEAILLLAKILRRHQQQGIHLFHIGGDDFEAISLNDQAVAWATEVKADFEREVVKLYDPEHRDKDCIEGVDRYGHRRCFPLMTVATAVILPEYTELGAQLVSSWTAIAKKQAKTTGEVCVFDRSMVS